MADDTEIARGNALAGGAVAIALLEHLYESNFLTLESGRAVLERAMKALGPVMQTPAGYQAAHVIGALQRGKFSARG